MANAAENEAIELFTYRSPSSAISLGPDAFQEFTLVVSKRSRSAAEPV
jgi:hypothetical protein